MHPIKFHIPPDTFTAPIFLLIFGAILAMLSGCAGQRLPEGGPIDTTAPEIDEVYPFPNTTNFTGQHITLVFSKYVDRRSVEESIFISPFVRDIEFDWSGKEVDLNFRDSLRRNTTYVVTVGTDVVDRRSPANRMAKSFTLAFSTGPQIDRGEIRGRLYDTKPSGVMVFAYRLDGLEADTLNPMRQKPDYITQCGNLGEYSLSHLAFGRYRLLAVRDEFRNLLYDPETDAMSTAPSDISLSAVDSLYDGVNFQLSTEDTTAPRLLEAVALDERHVQLKFTESIDSSSVSLKGFSISDTGRTRFVSIVDAFINFENPALITLVTQPLRDDSLFRVFAASVEDLAGHLINPLAMSKQFGRVAVPDTLPPRLLFATVADSISRIPLDESFRFDFDDALLRQSAEHSLELMRKDSSEVPVSFVWNSAASFTVVPREPLQPNSLYRFHILFDSLVDKAGNHLKDSTRNFGVRTVDPEQLSSIEGVLADADTSLINRYMIEAENSREQSKMPVRVAARRGEKFLLPQLRPGEYRLQAFQDLYGNGIYFSGRPFPFLPAERFSVYQDSIKVRARWPVDGVLIKMK
jgi:Bacterial Ig-like domain